MDTISKFKDAALSLQQDKVYLNYAQATNAYKEDKELQDKIGEYQLARLQLDNEMQKDAAERDQEKLTETNKKINTLYNEAMNAESMLALNEARAKIEEFVAYVNVIINTAIDGGNPIEAQPPEASGCSAGGCSSCSGCR